MNRTFELDQIFDALRLLDIDYEVFGEVNKSRFFFASLRSLEPGGIYFLDGEFNEDIGFSESVVLTNKKIDIDNVVALVVSSPQLVFYRLMRHLFPREPVHRIHETAIIDPEAKISSSAFIGPYCVIGKAVIGDSVSLHSHVVVFDDVEIGDGVVVEPHSTIGATGVAWIWDRETGERVIQPQIGGVYIGQGSFLGSDVTVVRGSVNENTTIGEYCVVAHGSKVGHGCHVASHVHFANNVSLAGNVNVGKRCFLGSGCAVRPRVTLSDDTVVGVGAVVVKDTPMSGLTLSGVPAKPMKEKTYRAGVPKSLR